MKSKYIYMTLIEQKLKTNVYAIGNKSGGYRIGIIKWYGPWRQYCFFPKEDTIWNKGCLEDVNEFIQGLMDERKADKPPRRG